MSFVLLYFTWCILLANTVTPRLTSDPANEFFG